MCIRYQPLLKNTTPFSCQPSPLNQQTVQAPFLGNPPSKSLFFQWTPKILKFLSLIPSYLLKVTKFLGNISQFEFLVMTEKNNFAYKLFLLLNISDLNLFFMWQLHPPPPWKKSPPLSLQPPSKSWGPVNPHPFWKFGWRLNSPPLQKGGCTLRVSCNHTTCLTYLPDLVA